MLIVAEILVREGSRNSNLTTVFCGGNAIRSVPSFAGRIDNAFPFASATQWG